jgi:hypothetical protein
MEELTPWFVHTLIGMCSEIVALRLKHIGRETF